MALNEQQVIAIRRHLGVPFAGTAQAGRLFGWRFEIHVEDLEWKMQNMQPSEEQLITGVSMGSWRIDGVPTAGDVITYSVTDPAIGRVEVTYTVTSDDINFIVPGTNQKSPTMAIALNSALAINNVLGVAGYQAVGVQPKDLFVAPPYFLAPYFAQLLISGPSSTLFTLGVARTGTTNVFCDNQGTISPVNTTVRDPSGVQKSLFGYVQVCDYFAMGMATASLSLRYEKADVVTFRKDEIKARRALYREYCEQLSKALGGREYVKKFGGGGGAAVA